MTDNKHILTIEELKTIDELKEADHSWASIRDNLFYTYENGYALTLTSLQQQYHQWRYKQNDPVNPNTGRWSTLEKEAVIALYNFGMPYYVMCQVLNRTHSSIYNKIRGLQYNSDSLFQIQTVGEYAEMKNNLKYTKHQLVNIGQQIVAKLNVAESEKRVKKEVKPMKKEIHNTNLKVKQGNPVIMDGDKQIDKTAHAIVEQCQNICDLLLAKNKQYGDSVSQPVRIFSKANTSEQIKVRIDDKISRLVRGDDSLEPDEDIIDDLIGYLILLKIQMNK